MQADTPNSLGSIFGRTMPLIRYFTFAGGALLAVSSYFPETETITRGDVARPFVRIASDRVGPPRVEFDTRVQTPVVSAPVPEVPQQAPALVVKAPLSVPLPAPAAAPTKVQHRFYHLVGILWRSIPHSIVDDLMTSIPGVRDLRSGPLVGSGPMGESAVRPVRDGITCCEPQS